MGGSRSGTRVSVQVLALAVCAVALCAAARYVPILGLLVSLLAPTPMLLATLRYGLRTGLLTLGLSALFLALLFGNLQSIIFLAEYGVMTLVMAEAIRRQWSVERTVLASTVLPAAASAVLLAILVSSVDLGTLKQHFEEDLSQALRQLASGEGGLDDAALRSSVQEVFGTVVRLLPALFVLSTAAGALLNYSVVRLIWARLGNMAPLPTITLAQWRAPEGCVWVLIGSGISSFLPLPGLQSVGLNVLVLVSLVYLVQGLGVMVFYMNRASVPPIWRGLVYFFLVIQPLFLLGVAAFGLFDLWCDFRRIAHQQEKTL
jgi:uncharacterized protein YybS (DUF2232 family)